MLSFHRTKSHFNRSNFSLSSSFVETPRFWHFYAKLRWMITNYKLRRFGMIYKILRSRENTQIETFYALKLAKFCCSQDLYLGMNVDTLMLLWCECVKPLFTLFMLQYNPEQKSKRCIFLWTELLPFKIKPKP